MIKIGELAKVCNTSIQTLRYYDKIGILCADVIDDQSGYRYYKPEKIKTYQAIAQLKKLDFSLDEIKEFLSCSAKEKYRMYQTKRMMLNKSIQEAREKVKRIDELCTDNSVGMVPIQKMFTNISFEDDSVAIGKWEYCGEMSKGERFAGETSLKKRSVNLKHLYFLPGGGNVWMYFWTNGIVYYCLPDFNVIVPNEYRIFTHGGETYMAVEWCVDRFLSDGVEETVRIYRKMDSKRYLERETREFIDDVNLTFVADGRVLGEWETVDIITDPSDFTADSEKWTKEPIWVEGLKFHKRGVCFKVIRHEETKYDRVFRYTSGVVLDEFHSYAEHYEIRRENGEDYLILEHKSGDYSYLGKIFCYYVFRRKTI